MTATSAPPSSAHGKTSARLAVLGAAVLWSTSGLFAKAPLFEGWDPQFRGAVLAFWRAVFAAMVLVPSVRRPRWRRALVPLAVCFTAMNVTFLSAMARTTSANAIWLQATSPWWVFLMSVLLLGEPIVRRDLVPLAFGALGVCTILWFELQHSDGLARNGVFLGLASGVFYAAVVILMRRLSAENSPWLVALAHGVTAAALLPVVVWLGVWPSAGQLLVLAGFGIVQMALPYLLLIRGLRSISGQEAVAIGLLEPVLNPIWTCFWGEIPAPWTIAGAVLILVGLVLRYGVPEGRA